MEWNNLIGEIRYRYHSLLLELRRKRLTEKFFKRERKKAKEKERRRREGETATQDEVSFDSIFINNNTNESEKRYQRIVGQI